MDEAPGSVQASPPAREETADDAGVGTSRKRSPTWRRVLGTHINSPPSALSQFIHATSRDTGMLRNSNGKVVVWVSRWSADVRGPPVVDGPSCCCERMVAPVDAMGLSARALLRSPLSDEARPKKCRCSRLMASTSGESGW